jgi:hypothetical protein
MKKILSILFAILILLSGIHVTIAIHYCGGELAASKVSVSGELASCGMEGPAENCPLQGKQMGNHCCDDKVSVLAVENSYAPSYFEFKAISHQIVHIFNFPANIPRQSIAVLNFLYTNFRPPGNYLVSDVFLSDICVFRI